jgi:hypothetical protein
MSRVAPVLMPTPTPMLAPVSTSVSGSAGSATGFAPITHRAAQAPGRPLSLHIDHIVLDGLALDARGRAELQAALEGELAELLARDGVGAGLLGDGAQARMRLDDVALPPGHDACRLGRAIARSLHAGMRR